MEYPKNHRLGLQILGYFVLVFLLCWIINLILGVIPNWVMSQLRFSENLRTYLGSTLTYGLRLVAVVVLSAWALRKVIGGNSWNSMFPHNGWWKDLLFGFLLAFAVTLSIFIIEIRAGWLVVETWSWQQISSDSYLRSMWLALLINLFVAVGEETMFRGYLLNGLKKAWGSTNGLLIMAFVFAAFHLAVASANETFPLIFILLLSIPGFILGWAFLHSRALWLPIGIHFSWNFMQDEVLNLHGQGASNLLGAVTRQNGPQWIVGTTYGIETGLVGILAMALIGFAVWLWSQRKREGLDMQQVKDITMNNS